MEEEKNVPILYRAEEKYICPKEPYWENRYYKTLLHMNRQDVSIVCNNYLEGLEWVFHKKISLKEALCGFVFEIEHLSGKRLALNNINNPTVIKPNFKKMVHGMGMTRDNSTGNMIIEFEIEFPESFTDEQLAGLHGIL